MKDYEKYIVDVKDFPKPGILFKDITPLLENSLAFRQVIYEMKSLIETIPNFNKIVCCDARGFLFGAPLALILNVPLILARKKGKLPRKSLEQGYGLEYGQSVLAITEDSIKKGDKIVVVDDLLATGGSVNAVEKIVKKLGGEVVGVCVLMELKELKGRDNLETKQVFSLLQY